MDYSVCKPVLDGHDHNQHDHGCARLGNEVLLGLALADLIRPLLAAWRRRDRIEVGGLRLWVVLLICGDGGGE